MLPMRIALAQNNLDIAEKLLMDVSHPESPNYGRHMTSVQIVDMFAPRQETVSAVIQWLHDFGINTTDVKTSASKGWFSFKLKVADAERLLKTKYYVYEHISGKRHPATEEYSVPAAIQHHIDFIVPTLHFDVKVIKNPEDSSGLKKRSLKDVSSVSTDPTHLAKIVGPVTHVRKGDHSRHYAQSKPDISLSTCSQEITPPCLQALYNFANYTQKKSTTNTFAVVEYTPQTYTASDLDTFFINYTTIPKGTRPILDSIDGGIVSNSYFGIFGYTGESNLDLQYAMTLVYPAQVILYQTGDIVEEASFNNFLDGIDAFYCNYSGGDSHVYDYPYPDPSNNTGSYKGHDCGRYPAANVISTSYGYNEADLSPAYEMRQCYEYMKLGIQGVTILYSSGDDGVAGNGGECINPQTGQYTTGSKGIKFNPSFPGTCPYVTSVGATQMKSGSSVSDPEIACHEYIQSGGGFSNVFALPTYQNATVNSYFTKYTPSYSSTQYNNSRKSRGYPDISANGANYVIVVGGESGLVYGTSCSSPVVGSIITLINDARLAVGKAPVGFLNPTLYANPGALNDITSGNNPGCHTNGFSAVTGWDPVTGLGTPNFPKLMQLFLSLP